ncbi:MAG: hypothetical protein E7483_02870 [Ruminococcaceae bacterium]|nr:hypothetical protein [Oscillospiraceae bacterium]
MLYKEIKKLAVKDLSQYHYLKNSIDTLSQEIKMLHNSSLYRSYSADNSVMSFSSADSKIINHISRIEYLENQLKKNTDKIKNIDLALDTLRASQKEILFSYYINRQRKAVTRLAIDTHTDRSALYRRANRALEKYILAYFGTLGE